VAELRLSWSRGSSRKNWRVRKLTRRSHLHGVSTRALVRACAAHPAVFAATVSSRQESIAHAQQGTARPTGALVGAGDDGAAEFCDGAAVLLGIGWRVDGEMGTKDSGQWGPAESIQLQPHITHAAASRPPARPSSRLNGPVRGLKKATLAKE
jgi:hypothetical protein